jgi:CRP-like cAMP-binding protein
MQYEKIEAGSVVCKQGAVANQMYLLMAGKCVATVNGRTVGKLTAVDVFGENALFGNGEQVRSATVTAVSALEVLVLTRQDLTALVESNHLDKTCLEELTLVAAERAKSNALLLKRKMVSI